MVMTRMKLPLLLAVLVSLTLTQGAPSASLYRSGYIVGGKDADPTRWPWQAALYQYGYMHCGASLISSRWLVTAAHCISRPITAYKIVLGLRDLGRKTGDPQDYTLEKIISHPHYDGFTEGFPNDIAVIRLSQSANTGSQYISTIPMANTGESFVGSSCYITGWGKTFASYPYYLQEAQVGIYSTSECKAKWGSSMIGSYHVCVGNGEKGLQGSCSGDSGGPLVCPRGDDWVLVGATSWGSGSCSPKWPSVYSSVAYFRDWIHSTSGV